ncbi:hypothetical protein IQ22_04342 [Pseudomonas duriflava]|uniref:Phytanoyl-CoA dioxygenase PhyH n=1 Tax=Pseudomonas duriflava TaxID=459528 RepID=A0A562PSB9_9PSED|nr:hypothetical protein [Pseudomonas duriflava]TWI47278.1 hypothetical protein IQ22_04342 [Pseudomonas duriflava]
MLASFRRIADQEAVQLASMINTQGYACLENYLDEAQLAQARAFVEEHAIKQSGRYFAFHGKDAVKGTVLDMLGSAPEFNELLHAIHLHGSGNTAHSPTVYQVLRCVQGNMGSKESNCFHYDATLLTVLIPIEIPDEESGNGDLLVFPNLRRVRRLVGLNVLEKCLLQNRLSRSLITKGIKHSLLKPLKLQLIPGNAYFFWGYRSLHANEPCHPDLRRATALFHYGDPHAGSLSTRLILMLNQRRARRRTNMPNPVTMN